MTTKHTPGPWRTNAYDHREIEALAGPEGERYVIGPIAVVYDIDSIRSGQAVGEANARLIVAAPDLLAACKAILRHDDSVLPHNAVDCATAPCAYCQVRNAIAKAEGR